VWPRPTGVPRRARAAAYDPVVHVPADHPPAPAPSGTAVARAVEAFARRFGGAPATVARAPGRVNLVGEHVDYADGVVLPIAIDRDCAVAVRAAPDGRWRAWSEDLRSMVELPDPATHAAQARATGPEAWSNLVTGVMVGFLREGAVVPPLQVAIASDIPIGAGLASSAALGVALATALADALRTPLFGLPLARLAHEAECEFLGIPSGMMDQVASALGRAGHAMLVDCRSLDVRFVPFPPDDVAAVWVIDPGVHRSLADGRYAERRREVDEATRALGVRSLRDADEPMLRTKAMPDLLVRRARHVIRETQRVQAAANALRRGDLQLFGMYMAQSHQSLRDDFAVSTPELDALVDAARAIGDAGGAHGARLTGAGFGGSVIVLADAPRGASIPERIASGFERRFRRRPTWMRVTPGPGAAVLPPTRWS
jgi:galactokinase